MKNAIFLSLFFCFSYSSYCQGKNKMDLTLSAGPFKMGKKNTSAGIWVAVGAFNEISKLKKGYTRHLSVGGEVFFENGFDKTTVLNPTIDEFLHQLFFQEANTGINGKIIYHPFKGIMNGLYIGGGPLLVFSIRTIEKRAQLIQYNSTVVIRMSELKYENKLLSGYRITAGYDFYFAKKLSLGIRADLLQYFKRDLNSLLAIKGGYSF